MTSSDPSTTICKIRPDARKIHAVLGEADEDCAEHDVLDASDAAAQADPGTDARRDRFERNRAADVPLAAGAWGKPKHSRHEPPFGAEIEGRVGGFHKTLASDSLLPGHIPGQDAKLAESFGLAGWGLIA